MARGFAHIGVLRTLNKHGIYPTILAGTSIGALVGGSYLAGKLDDLEDWVAVSQPPARFFPIWISGSAAPE